MQSIVSIENYRNLLTSASIAPLTLQILLLPFQERHTPLPIVRYLHKCFQGSMYPLHQYLFYLYFHICFPSKNFRAFRPYIILSYRRKRLLATYKIFTKCVRSSDKLGKTPSHSARVASSGSSKSGIMKTRHPAAAAARTPFGESSIAIQSDGIRPAFSHAS